MFLVTRTVRVATSLYRVVSKPNLFVLASGEKPGVFDQAVKLKLTSFTAVSGNPGSAAIFSGPERDRIRLELALFLHGKGLSTLTGKVTLIGTGNFELMSAHGGKLSLTSNETEIVGFRIGATEFKLDRPLRVTVRK